MKPEIAFAPAFAGDLAVSVTIAVAVTAIAAVVMLVAMLRRSAHNSSATVALAAFSGVALLAGALLVGSSLTQLPTAAATSDKAPRSATVPAIESKLTGLQLPTI